MLKFKPLSCPNCNNSVARVWEIFILFSPLWVRGKCRYCSKDLKVNYNTIIWLISSISFCFILANFLKFFFSFQSLLYDIISLCVFVLLPFYLGKQLFELRE